jgi:hypothetical protein
MKTTIDINDELFRSARRHAAESGTTLRALVEEGLRRVMARVGDPPAEPLFQVRVIVGDAGLVQPYDRLGLQQAILDTYRQVEGDASPPGAVHDRA